VCIAPAAAQDRICFVKKLQLKNNDPPNLGFWSNLGDYPSWTAEITKPGSYVPELLYALESKKGTEIILSAGEEQVKAKLDSSGGWKVYQTLQLPPLKITKAGTVNITLKAVSKSVGGAMNLRSITLKPSS